MALLQPKQLRHSIFGQRESLIFLLEDCIEVLYDVKVLINHHNPHDYRKHDVVQELIRIQSKRLSSPYYEKRMSHNWVEISNYI